MRPLHWHAPGGSGFSGGSTHAAPLQRQRQPPLAAEQPRVAAVTPSLFAPGLSEMATRVKAMNEALQAMVGLDAMLTPAQLESIKRDVLVRHGFGAAIVSPGPADRVRAPRTGSSPPHSE